MRILISQAKTVCFGTGNLHKVAEASAILEPYGWKVVHENVNRIEIQSDSIKDIAIYSLACLSDKKNFFIEDTGLFIPALNGFPGPYAAYVMKTLTPAGILTLYRGLQTNDRTAYFESVIAFRDNSGKIHTFSGMITGQISFEVRGVHWGFDPIFVPDDEVYNPGKLTFAEMSVELKNRISHRSRALHTFAEFLNNCNNTNHTE